MAYIELKEYTKKIKGNVVLDDVNVSVEKGAVIGLHGRNASGKTMLLRAMSGLIKPTSGKAIVNGVELIGNNRFPKSCGMIIETIKFWPNLSAQETLEIIASINNTATEEDILASLEKVGLDPKDTRKVKKFSLGMRQKLALAQAIFEKPDLLLLDEPTNSLDEVARQGFTQMIAQEKERGCTIVMASHILEDLQMSCDQIVEVADGRIR